MNISVGNEEIESNRNRKRIGPLEPMETLKILKMDVQSRRVDNGRMLRTQERQNQLKNQVVQSLN
jgi:hypothetical protein